MSSLAAELQEPEEPEYVDAARACVEARWGSLLAPLLPSQLFAREATALFASPWRRARGPVLFARAAALRALACFEAACRRALALLSPGERLCWSYSLAVLLATLAGGAPLAPPGLDCLLALGGSAPFFAGLLFDAAHLLKVGLPRGSYDLLCGRARHFALASAAAWLLPRPVLATHLALSLLCGCGERALACLARLLAAVRRAVPRPSGAVGPPLGPQPAQDLRALGRWHRIVGAHRAVPVPAAQQRRVGRAQAERHVAGEEQVERRVAGGVDAEREPPAAGDEQRGEVLRQVVQRRDPDGRQDDPHVLPSRHGALQERR